MDMNAPVLGFAITASTATSHGPSAAGSKDACALVKPAETQAFAPKARISEAFPGSLLELVLEGSDAPAKKDQVIVGSPVPQNPSVALLP